MKSAAAVALIILAGAHSAAAQTGIDAVAPARPSPRATDDPATDDPATVDPATVDPATVDPATDNPAEEVRTVFESATRAAQDGDAERSLKAVRELLGNGPPLKASIGSLFLALTGQTSETEKSNRVVMREISLGLIQLDELWRAQKFPAADVYATLREIVLPAARRHEIFRYALSEVRSASSPSVGRLLAERAVDAGRVDELRKAINQRVTEKANPNDRHLLMELAVVDADFDQILAELEQLTRTLDTNPRVEVALSLLPQLSLALSNEDAGFEAIPLVERVAEILQPSAVASGTWPTVATLLKTAARMRFEESDPTRAGEHLQSLLEIYRGVNRQDLSENHRYRWSQRFAQVANEYLRGEQTADALVVLAEAADLQLPLRQDSVHGGLASSVAGLNRRLIEMEPEVRYALLRDWTLPDASHRELRVLASIAPTHSPPNEFARALGERPGSDAFPVARIGEVDGIFSTVWALVQSARAAGQLRSLTTRLEELAQQQISHARFAHQLARIAAIGSDDNLPALADELRAHAATLRKRERQPGASSTDVSMSDIVLATACLSRPALRPIGEDMLLTLIEHTYGGDSLTVRPWLRVAHARAILMRNPAASPELLSGSSLQDWFPASSQYSWRHAQGAARDVWLTHEDHILHLAGPRNDFLCFRYPLTGEFEFTCEARTGGAAMAEGGLAYDGLAYQAWPSGQMLRVWGVDIAKPIQVFSPLLARNNEPRYQRLGMRSSANGVSFLINGRPVWRDWSKSESSPWLALRSFSGRPPAFRKLRITGNPVIPREVRLTGGDVMRGWFASYFGERSPHVLPSSESASIGMPADSGDFDWFMRDGVVHGKRRRQDFAPAVQSRLHYFRPLQNHESVSYEFYYEPGRCTVHPSLGRMAFLLDPSGVRLHWTTTGSDEWTGLPDDNSIVEPLNRRGPRRLPLKSGEWNQATISLANDTVTLSLNGIEIYARKLEPGMGRTFGFYHDRNRTAVQLRHVVMRGDWPETLPAAQLANLTTNANHNKPLPDRRALGELFADRHLVDSTLGMHSLAASMPAEERYKFLSQWVLPGDDHNTFRTAVGYWPTHPAPPVASTDPPDLERVRIAAKSGTSRVQTGGNAVSPAIDLVHVAQELGRLDELRGRVENVRPGNEDSPEDRTRHRERARLALLAIIDIERKDFESALKSLDQLSAIVATSSHTSFVDHWPEILALHVATQHSETLDGVRDLVHHLVLGQIRKGDSGGSEAWLRQMCSQMGLLNFLERETQPKAMASRTLENFGTPPTLKQWSPASRTSAPYRGAGCPISHWQATGGEVANLSGHHDDYLYFQSPLTGNFQVECDVTAFGWRDSTLSVAGTFVAARYNLKEYSAGNFRRGTTPWTLLDPPLMRPGTWMRYRSMIKDGVQTTYLNGRNVDSRPVAKDHDPWVAVRSLVRNDGAVRNLRVTGKPVIPATLRLTAHQDLPGWTPYFMESVGRVTDDWRQRGDLPEGGGLVGAHRPEFAGTSLERLLQYHRPMLENGNIEYEFYYAPGESHVHPAMDRLAFLLEPDGVRVHWITDGPFDRTDLSADNVFDEPINRVGDDQLPLMPNAWNHLLLSLMSDVVQLTLNEQLVYERQLEVTNQRTFGLFHYADRTEARVRNVRWHGQWPRELPSIADQELAGAGTEFLDAALPELTAVFEHDFAQDGLPQHRFSVYRGQPAFFTHTPRGVLAERQGAKSYLGTTITPSLALTGNYDITVKFNQLKLQPSDDGTASIFLLTVMDNPYKTEALMYQRHIRGDGKDRQKIVQGGYVSKEPEGERREWMGTDTVEATSGSLRIARRGDTLYFLFADGESPNFRLFGTEAVTGEWTANNGIRLAVQTSGPGFASVVWEKLTIRAEALSGTALEDPKERLAILDAARDALPQHYEHDFTRADPTTALFNQWDHVVPLKHSPDGVKVVAEGSDTWKSSGLAPYVSVSGDFDIAVDLNLIRFAQPKPKENSGAYFQLEFADENKTQLDFLFRQIRGGKREVYLQLRDRDEDDKPRYTRIKTATVDRIATMRFHRQGSQITCLYRGEDDDQELILAEMELGDWDIPKASVRLMLHTGGADRKSELFWKRLTIHAEELGDKPAPAVTGQGKRILKCWNTKDLHQIVHVPTCFTASHRDAFLVFLLLQEAD